MRAKRGQFIMGAISLLSNEFNGFGDDIIEELTYKQWFLLMMLSRMEETGSNINTIADFVGTTRQNIKKMLTPLEEKGFVSIVRSGADARSLSVELTKKSYDFFRENDGKIAMATEQLFAPLSEEEMDVLTSLLKKLMLCIEEYAEKHATEN